MTARLDETDSAETIAAWRELDRLQAIAEEQARLEAIERCVDLDEESPEAAIEQLRREPDREIGSPWRAEP